ncbi:endolytic transglycosylase MltG [Patescibacteria group bacterium]|nr:endolytic transglycosylase MltG [Patescibacteria group bacterium]
MTTVIIALAGAVFWWKWAASPVDSASAELVAFSIRRGESIDSISKRLKDKNIIRTKAAFRIVLITGGLAKRIQAGEFELSKAMATQQIASALTVGRADVKVTLIEGWRREEIADELEKQLTNAGASLNREEFLQATQGKEGYLFPDTYLIPKKMQAREIAELLLETFEKKVDATLRASIKRQGLSLDQALIIASVVEREARANKDRPLVAGIFIRRLRASWPLQADATVQYALGFQAQEQSWWKKSLTREDLKINSPYNTYKQAGLPPAPICNPSLASIQAVANQKATKYWYYISDKKGELHYAETIEEHNANIAKYLNK